VNRSAMKNAITVIFIAVALVLSCSMLKKEGVSEGLCLLTLPFLHIRDLIT
jgi:hypothetical protein